MRSSLIGGVALILLGALAAWAEEKTETKKTLESGSLRIELRGTGQEGGGGIMLAPAGGNVVLSFGETAQPSQYWLGCQVAAVPEKQAKELKLPAGEGLLVEQVMPESPAAKGGIKPKDVLHKVGKRTIKKVSDLIEVIEKAKATDLVIEVIRDGKPEKVTVKPAKRPVPQAMNRAVTLSGASAWAWPNVALPDDMTVTLTKTGKKPA
ncbi:MAG: PDZ domain-containing protein [Thermoguttaceae bacterium]